MITTNPYKTNSQTRPEASQTLPTLLRKRVAGAADKPAFSYKTNNRWILRTWGQFFTVVNDFAAILQSHGVKKGDKIALLLPNSYEWEIAQHAALMMGAVVVGIEPQADPKHTNFVLMHSGATAVIVFDQEQLNKIHKSVLLTKIKTLITVKHAKREDHAPLAHFWDLIEKNPIEQVFKEPTLTGHDPAFLIYSSGSTGTPKGILYNHRDVVLAVQEIVKLFDTKGATLCWLPLANLFQRILNFCALQTGSCVFFVEDPKAVMDAIKEVEPTYLIGVPRFYEKLYQGILDNINQMGLFKRWLVKSALYIGRKQRGKTKGYTWSLCDRMVFKKIRKVLGKNLHFMVSGSAPLAPSIVRFFSSIGIPLLEAYGCSENIVPMSINSLEDFQAGTVGQPLKANQIRISDEGEIQVKGPGVFRGYYKEPIPLLKFTKDGFYKTGDLGYFTSKGHLKIIGRNSDIIVTSTGRKISPVKVEAVYQRLPYVQHVVVMGQNEKVLSGLVTIDWNMYRRIHGTTHNANERIKKDLHLHDRLLPPHEQVASWNVIKSNFSPQTGELTLNLKLRRKYIQEKYK